MQWIADRFNGAADHTELRRVSWRADRHRGPRRRRQAHADRGFAGGVHRRRPDGGHAWPSRATASRSPPIWPARRCTARHGDLAGSVYAMAVLFALDRAARQGPDRGPARRARRGHPGSLRRLQRRLQCGAAEPGRRRGDGVLGRRTRSTAGWGCPNRTTRSCSMSRWNWPPSAPGGGPSEETDRARDAYERDAGLQQRTAAVYAGLAEADWHGRWSVVGADVDAEPGWPTRCGLARVLAGDKSRLGDTMDVHEATDPGR